MIQSPVDTRDKGPAMVDDASPGGKPKPFAPVPGTQPNINVAPLPGVGAITPSSGATQFTGPLANAGASGTTPQAPSVGAGLIAPGAGASGATFAPSTANSAAAPISTAGRNDPSQVAADQAAGITRNPGGFDDATSTQARGLGYTIAGQGDPFHLGTKPGDLVDPTTRTIVGNVNDPSFNLSALQAVRDPSSGDLRVPGGANLADQTQFTASGQAIGGTSAAPSPTSSAPASGLPTTGPVGGGSNVATTPTNPATGLTTQTISRAPTANRADLAKQYADQWQQTNEPKFQADLRQATRLAAGKGQLNTGELRTNLGNITQSYGNARDAASKGFYTDALNGAIADSFGDVGIAQQQQGFQSGQQQTAFNQALQQALAEDQLTGSSFQRALDEAKFGYQGNPGDTQLALAGIYGNQANKAGTAAGQYGQASTSGGANSYSDLLAQALRGYLPTLLGTDQYGNVSLPKQPLPTVGGY